MMKIAVIGGSGFIGSHVVDKLLEAGHDVTVFDIMRPHRDYIRHVFLDLLDFHRVVVALAGGFDAVYLLAAMANVDDVVESPLESVLVNSQGAVNVLEAVRRHGGRLILASTSWIYTMAGDNGAAHPSIDEEEPLRLHKVNHVYTASKIAAELYIRSYNTLYGVEYTILRYGTPYGPRGRKGTVISNCIEQALCGKPLIIKGDGRQTRNFVYVEDLAEGNVAALQPAARNGTFNLDGRRSVSIREIAETIRNLLGSVEIRYEEGRPGDFQGGVISCERALTDLGWSPKTEIREGISRYIDWRRGVSSSGNGHAPLSAAGR
jgi:UDP-glucose 4-epimerase